MCNTFISADYKRNNTHIQWRAQQATPYTELVNNLGYKIDIQFVFILPCTQNAWLCTIYMIILKIDRLIPSAAFFLVVASPLPLLCFIFLLLCIVWLIRNRALIYNKKKSHVKLQIANEIRRWFALFLQLCPKYYMSEYDFNWIQIRRFTNVINQQLNSNRIKATLKLCIASEFSFQWIYTV